MVRAKRCAAAVLLAVCFTLVVLAGVLFVGPVQVRAATAAAAGATSAGGDEIPSMVLGRGATGDAGLFGGRADPAANTILFIKSVRLPGVARGTAKNNNTFKASDTLTFSFVLEQKTAAGWKPVDLAGVAAPAVKGNLRVLPGAGHGVFFVSVLPDGTSDGGAFSGLPDGEYRVREVGAEGYAAHYTVGDPGMERMAREYGVPWGGAGVGAISLLNAAPSALAASPASLPAAGGACTLTLSGTILDDINGHQLEVFEGGRKVSGAWATATTAGTTTVQTATITFPANTAADARAYTVRLDGQTAFTATVTVAGTGSASPAAPAPDVPVPISAAAEYINRHFNFWLPVFVQLKESGNGGSVTVDTSGMDIEHISHFVFDMLVGTNRTLTVKHKGETYIINGAPESADHLRMGGILLGHNHSFDMLEGYRVK